MKVSDRLLVTGGSGFIGTNLVDAGVAMGSQVLNFDLRPPKKSAHASYWFQGNLLDPVSIGRAVADFKPSVIIHLAARTDLDETTRLDGYAVNFDGTDNLIEAARQNRSVERIVFASTMLVTRPGHVPAADDEYSPHTLYGKSKVLMEERIRAAADVPFRWCIVRPSLVWGPWLGAHYQSFFQLVARGKYFHVGNGAALRSLGYVGNVVRHLLSAATAAPERIDRKVFYVGDDQPTTLKDWAEEIRRQLSAPRIRSIPYPLARAAASAGDVLRKVGIPAPIYSFRLRNIVTDWVLPVQPMVDLASPGAFTMRDGVAATIEWLRAENILS